AHRRRRDEPGALGAGGVRPGPADLAADVGRAAAPGRQAVSHRLRGNLVALLATFAAAVLGSLLLGVIGAEPAAATPLATVVEPAPPTDPPAPAAPGEEGRPTVTVDINGVDGTPSSSITVLLAITVLSVAPALLLMMTSFTKIFVVLALTRNAMGL